MNIPNRLLDVKDFLLSKTAGVSRKNKVIASCLIFSTLALGMTNPKQEDYIDYASNRLYNEAKAGCGNLSQNVRIFLIGVPTGDICRVFVMTSDKIGRPISRRIIERVTEDRKNIGLFSLYTTKMPGGKTYRTIGIGTQFVVVSGG